MKISSGEIRKGSNSIYLVCLDAVKEPTSKHRYYAVNLKTGATLPVNSTFAKSTTLVGVQVVTKSGVEIVKVNNPVYYAVVNRNIVERISFEKFELKSASERTGDKAVICMLKASVKPMTKVNNILRRLDDF